MRRIFRFGFGSSLASARWTRWTRWTRSILWIWLCVSAQAGEPVPWSELALAIEPEPGISSDNATICRVRVVNNGRGTWQGRDITFEARAIRDGRIAARAPGRFGLTLGPHETLETVVGFIGRFDRLEVVPADHAGGGGGRSSKRGSSKKKKSAKKGKSRKG